jgi:glycerol-3-phosphate dehydrogenase (NAD(P)+)
MSAKVTVLGAGAMGSALATPFRSAGWEVNLWGTWLDDHLLAACAADRPHPRTDVRLAGGTALFDSERLAEALDGADLSVLAIASVGVIEVARRALKGIAGTRAVLLTSKGFAPDDEGSVRLLPDALRELAREHGAVLPPIVAVGGPCKANEVAAGRSTATIFGCRDVSLAEELAGTLGTDAYRAEATDDETGVEICAPMKNVYAIALGFADGLEERHGEPFHNLKAATFTQALRELGTLCEMIGGRFETAAGLAGVGDLEVTGLSGRNKVYGARIGKGEPASDALRAMVAAEQTVEGVPAARLAKELVDQRDASAWPSLPLLAAILDVIDDDRDPVSRIVEAVLPRTRSIPPSPVA